MARKKQPAGKIDIRGLDPSEIRVRLKELGPVAEIRLTRSNLPLFDDAEYELNLSWGAQRKKYSVPVQEGKVLFNSLPETVEPLGEKRKTDSAVIRDLTLSGAGGELSFNMGWGYVIPQEWRPLEQVYSRVLEMARRYSGWQVF